MEFEIIKIKPSMSHEEKVYEYARRISYYSQVASKERKESKIFKCQNLVRNLNLSGKKCGCFSNDITFSEARGNETEDTSPCEQCQKARVNYIAYRDAKSKQGAAMRQLSNEMNKSMKGELK